MVVILFEVSELQSQVQRDCHGGVERGLAVSFVKQRAHGQGQGRGCDFFAETCEVAERGAVRVEPVVPLGVGLSDVIDNFK